MTPFAVFTHSTCSGSNGSHITSFSGIGKGCRIRH
jgi:hypothetical protein